MRRRNEIAPVVRGPRPEGTDGSDHAFRMIIENKYKRIAVMKKYSRFLFYCHVPLMMLLGLWCAVPTIVKQPYPYQVIILLVLELMAIIAFRLAAIGQGKEKMFYVKAYGILMTILTAEHVLIRFWYHVKFPKHLLYPNLLSRVLEIGLLKNADLLRLALTVWEATLDGSLFCVLTASTFCVRSYVEEKRTPDPVVPSSQTERQDQIKEE